MSVCLPEARDCQQYQGLGFRPEARDRQQYYRVHQSKLTKLIYVCLAA